MDIDTIKSPMAKLTRTHPVSVMSDPRWAALAARDPHADGQFYYAVKTTGVYCRPSCPARRPKPEHVSFHATAVAAERAGFRACKRCKPKQAPLAAEHAAKVAELCRYLDEAAEMPSLTALASRAGLSVYHLHRVFKAIMGLTPRAYAAARRAARVEQGLRREANVTTALYAAGYSSSSRFYNEAKQRLGMTPSEYRARGKGVSIRFAVGQCSLGAILVAASPQGVCAIALGDDPEKLVRELQDRFAEAELIGQDENFERTVAEVVGCVEAPERPWNLPLDLRGTAFQERVWRALQQIPLGRTTSYSALAEDIGAPQAARAVARACAANPLAVAIPCHRVVRLDGSLASYRWGVERKRALLAAECASLTAAVGRRK